MTTRGNWIASLATFASDLSRIANRALATLAELRGREPDTRRAQYKRDHARHRAAEHTIRLVGLVRETLVGLELGAPVPPTIVLELLRHAVQIGRLADDGVLARSLAREFRRRYEQRVQVLAAINRAHRLRNLEALEHAVAALRVKHPDISDRGLARLLDPRHAERMRKRIARMGMDRKKISGAKK